MTDIRQEDLNIDSLGPCEVPSPARLLLAETGCESSFVADSQRIVFHNELDSILASERRHKTIPSVELAGPRRDIYFDPAKTACAIVSCGGLCPGINDVIRGLVMTLHYRYGVRRILGIRYGYRGFARGGAHPPLALTPESVTEIHKDGGTLLASSRGPQDTNEIIDFLREQNVQILFTIGGDGTLRGALEIAETAEKRGEKISVVGIPKTVDNDILHIDQSFGFETAFSEAVKSISAANNEALGAPNGVGLVKLMGRHSGFIASYAALAVNDVNYVLIPEVPFDLDGPKGFLGVLRERLERRHHAVIVVAEGAGQEHLERADRGRDASGNVRFGDIGLYLKERIADAFAGWKTEVNVKYIDPSYSIRAVPASPQDSIYCLRLAHNAVHAAMCGKTKVVIGRRHEKYVHLPMRLLSAGRKRVDPHGALWHSVLEATGQPPRFGP